MNMNQTNFTVVKKFFSKNLLIEIIIHGNFEPLWGLFSSCGSLRMKTKLFN